jgi:hypothetical protein
MNLVPLFSRIQLGLVFFLIFFSINLNAQNIDCNNLIILSCGDFFGSQQLTTLYEDNKFNYSNNYSTCFNSNASFNESDLIFRFEKFDYSDTYITLFNYGNVDLDLILFDDCTSIPSLMNCVDASTRSYGEPINGVNIDFIHLIDPGTYFFVVDGYTIGHKGDFYINIGCDDLQYSDCDNVPVVECNVPSDGTTCPANGNIWWTTEINNYDCLLGHSKQASLTGREEVYSFIAPESGEYTFNLSNFSQDLDMFLIDDACAGGNGGGGGGGTIINPNLSSRYNCLDFSANFGTQVEEITVNLSKDEKIYIVIDGFLDACSDFTLIVNGCTIQDEICDFCCDNLNAIYSDCVGFENYSFGNLLPQGSKKFKLFNPNTSNNSQSGLVVGGGKAKTGNWCLELDATTDIDYKINRQINDIARLEWSMNFPKDKYGAVGLQIGDQSYYPIFVHFEKGLAKVYQKNANNTSTLLTQFNYTEQKWDQYALIIRSDGRMGNQKGEIELWKDSTFIYRLQNVKINSLVDFNMFYHPNYQSKSNFFIDNICYHDQKKAIYFPQYFEPTCVDGYNSPFANPHYAYDAGYTNCEIRKCNAISPECYFASFEQYDLGGINDQSFIDKWEAFPYWPSNQSSGVITDFRSFSGYKSLRFDASFSEYRLGNIDSLDGNFGGSKVWRYSWKMFIPKDSIGYFGFYHTERINNKAFDVNFDLDGKGYLYLLNGLDTTKIANFNYPINSWFSATIIIRLLKDETELWINGKFVAKWQFSLGNPPDPKQIGSIAFERKNSKTRFYLDDFLCEGNDGETCWGSFWDCTLFPPIVCVNNIQYGDSISLCGGLLAHCQGGYTEEEWTEGPCINKIIVDIDDDVCSNQYSIVEVPVRVRNYKNMGGIQMSIKSSNTNVAEIIGYSNLNPQSGLNSSHFNLSNGLLIMLWDGSPVTLADNSVLFTIQVKLNGASGSKANLEFSNNPDLAFYDGNLNNILGEGILGSVCISSTALIIKGNILNPNQLPFNNTEVRLESTTVQTKNTNTTGSYEFTNLTPGNNYILRPRKNTDLFSGVDLADVIILRKHIIGSSKLNSPYKYVAADINEDLKLDIGDVAFLRKISSKTLTALPNGNDHWRFVPKSFQFSSPNPLLVKAPKFLEYNPLNSSKLSEDFIGFKIGDLNFGLAPMINNGISDRSSGNVLISSDKVEGQVGQKVEVGIKAQEFNKVIAMQFSLKWDPLKIIMSNVPSGNDIIIKGSTTIIASKMQEGFLGILWEAPDDSLNNGTTLSANSLLYNLRFEILSGAEGIIEIIKSENPIECIAYNFDVEEQNFIFQSGYVKVISSAIDETDFSNKIILYPNPTDGNVNIESELSIYKIEVFSFNNKSIIKRDNINSTKEILDLKELISGIYIIKIQTNTGIVYKKLNLIKNK